jgi:2,5-furandicarboxylate decarboxylase 1
MVKERNRLGIAIDPGRHLGTYYQRAEEMGKPLEVAIVVGGDPVLMIASQAIPKKGIYGDELAVAGGLRGKPVELVRCQTIDVEVPATAEVIIEGEIPPKVREIEGPFGEMSGYYGAGVLSPIIRVKAITMREDAVYHAIHSGRPPNEGHIMRAIAVDASFYRYIRQVCPTVKAVHFTPGGTGQNHVVISIKQTYREEAKNVMVRDLT